MTKLSGNMIATGDLNRRGDGTAPRRTRLSAAERRETILYAATEMFAQTGYRAGKVSDVAARVGVTEPVIFQNFGSKAALFAAVLEHAAAAARASLDHLAAGFGSWSGLLAHVLGPAAETRPGQSTPSGARHEDTHPGAAYGVLFGDAAALSAEPDLTEVARNAVRTVVTHLADLIERAQADGGIRRDADPQAAAWLLLSVLSARRMRAAVMPADLEPAVATLALGALAPPGEDLTL